MEEEIMLENIVFEYGEGVHPSADKEADSKRNLNMWFRPLIQEFNNEKAVIKVFFLKDEQNSMMFESISEDLKSKAIKELNTYRIESGYLPYIL